MTICHGHCAPCRGGEKKKKDVYGRKRKKARIIPHTKNVDMEDMEDTSDDESPEAAQVLHAVISVPSIICDMAMSLHQLDPTLCFSIVLLGSFLALAH
jgi:hypothetical protein